MMLTDKKIQILPVKSLKPPFLKGVDLTHFKICSSQQSYPPCFQHMINDENMITWVQFESVFNVQPTDQQIFSKEVPILFPVVAGFVCFTKI